MKSTFLNQIQFNLIKFLLLVTVFQNVLSKQQNDPATNQIVNFKKKTAGPIGTITTSAGEPVDFSDATYSLNSNLLTNENLIEVITHLTRERIPERFTHAKGAGAFGYFETTCDLSHICKAKLFCGVGKKTPIAARFSPAVIERGGVETLRDIRGFAVKFYTEDGNFDIVGLNTPVFAIKDPVFFGSLFHSQKRNPATNLLDKNLFWDFLTLYPETFYILLLLLSDLGIPDGYRHMPGYSIHTYEIYNEQGVKSFVRFHFTPDAGLKNFNSTTAAKIAGRDPDYATRDLYTAIGNGEYPSWQVSLQILSAEDVKNASFDIYDVTRKLPENLYPLHPVGRIVLNENPINYFAQIEQLAFSPANLVPGILGGSDKLFEMRRFAYRDAQNYRLGVNYNNILVNCPLRKVLTYNRDGVPPVKENGRDSPNYYPNSFNGPIPYTEKNRPQLTKIHEDEPNNFDQATNYYLNELSCDERTRLIENIIGALCPATAFLQERAIKIFTIIHPDLGKKVSKGLAAFKTTQCPTP